MSRFADPYKQCTACRAWVDGVAQSGPPLLIPCGHRSEYADVCPSWSPVDGCGCAAYTARHPDDPIVHAMRVPEPGDTRVYGPAPS